MRIKFCTPYYNEFNYDRLGNIIPDPDNAPPSENSINGLVKISNCDHLTFQPGVLYATPWFEFTWQRCRGTYIAESRNAMINLRRSNAIQQTLPESFDYYITLDTDISFTAEQIRALLEHDQPIIGAAYADRVNQSAYVGGWFSDTKGVIGTFVKNNACGLVKVDWIGMGLCCIKREVIQSLPFPWFDSLRITYTENGEKCALRTGEDIGFCLNAYRCGFEVYMDCDCVAGHHT